MITTPASLRSDDWILSPESVDTFRRNHWGLSSEYAPGDTPFASVRSGSRMAFARFTREKLGQALSEFRFVAEEKGWFGTLA